MELDRKKVTVILIALIIIVPVVAVVWYAWGPTRLDEIVITQVVLEDVNRKSVKLIGAAEGGGSSFEEDVDLIIFYDDEQVYKGKVPFKDNLLNHNLPLNEFARGNGQYEFRLRYEEFKDSYFYDLVAVVEELNVFATTPKGDQTPIAGVNPWETVYHYTITFASGWHFFTYDIDPGDFMTWELGYIGAGNSTTYEVETDIDGGVTAKLFYNKGTTGARDDVVYERDVPAGQTFSDKVDHNANGTYKLNFYNEGTVPVVLRIYQSIPIKTPRDQDVSIEFASDGTVWSPNNPLAASKVEVLTGDIDPPLGTEGVMDSGYYNITVKYDQSIVADGSAFKQVTNRQELLLNDRPVADAGSGAPYSIPPITRTVTFEATLSFDDGPKEDLHVEWSAGNLDDGTAIWVVQGTWEELETWTFMYPLGENPGSGSNRPYLIVRDAFGEESKIYYINMS
jgi:hypothetical protein